MIGRRAAGKDDGYSINSISSAGIPSMAAVLGRMVAESKTILLTPRQSTDSENLAGSSGTNSTESIALVSGSWCGDMIHWSATVIVERRSNFRANSLSSFNSFTQFEPLLLAFLADCSARVMRLRMSRILRSAQVDQEARSEYSGQSRRRWS